MKVWLSPRPLSRGLGFAMRTGSRVKPGMTVLFFMLMAFQLSAWSRSGHQIVAQIAWNQFSEAEQKKVKEVLGDLIEMAAEPDEYREISPIISGWHYIDYPLVEEPVTSVLKLVKKRDNIVWALGEVKRVLKKNKSHKHPGFARVFKSNLVHLIGDIHQPLHCIARVTQKNPQGDKGGNLVSVIFDSKKINLHRLWDIGLGMLEEMQTEQMVDVAKKIEKEYPASTLMLTGTYEDWSKESYALAKNYVYKVTEDQPVSQAYISEGQKIIGKRLAQAGYRLAKEIRELI